MGIIYGWSATYDERRHIEKRDTKENMYTVLKNDIHTEKNIHIKGIHMYKSDIYINERRIRTEDKGKGDPYSSGLIL